MIAALKKILITERIPPIVCMTACLASVLMGFMLGYIFFVPGEYTLAYADAVTPYQMEEPYHTAAAPEIFYPYMLGPAESQPEEEPCSHLYVVTTLGGYLVVYHADKNGGGIKEVTSTAVGALAPEELERLKIGIRVYSDEALARILQDYGS